MTDQHSLSSDDRVAELIAGWTGAFVLAESEGDRSEYLHSLLDTVAALGELQRLRRGEYICRECGLRKDGEIDATADF